MKLNVDDYRKNKPFVVRIAIENGLHTVSFVAANTGIPVLAILHFIAEDIGYTKEILLHIKKVMHFYKYTHISGTADIDIEAELAKLEQEEFDNN
jgi:hypothetical protein